MKHQFLTTLAALIVALSTLGSSCVNDNVLVAVNLTPISARFRLGTGAMFAGAITVNLDSLIAAEYKNKLRQGRVYDFKVRVEGEYSGAIAGAAAIRVDSAQSRLVLRFPETGSVPWSVFYTPQSLLTSSQYLSPQSEGIAELLRALTMSPLPRITVSTLGALNGTPIPDNLYVTIDLFLQADAQL